MTAIGDALKSRAVVGTVFVEIDLAEEPVRAFGGIGTYQSPDGRTWSGISAVGRLSPVRTAEGVSAAAFTVGFDTAAVNADAEAFAEVAAAVLADRDVQVQGRRVRVYLGIFDATAGSLVGGALRQIASGVASHRSTSWSSASLSMTLHCEPLIGSMWTSRGRLLTHEDQQHLFPGDMGLEFKAIIANGGRNVVWNPGV